MQREWKSFLGGAAVAAALIAPTLAYGEAPDGPPAPRAQAAVEAAHTQALTARTKVQAAMSAAKTQTVAPANTDNWVVRPQRNFPVRKLHIGSLVGAVKIEVKDSGPITLDVAGTKQAVDALSINVENGILSLDGSHGQQNSVWDWRKWLDFSDVSRPQRSKLGVRLVVPRGTDIEVKDFVGDATIGDTMGKIDFEATATKTKIGRVSNAKISLEGAGHVDLAQVSGPLEIEIDGSGKVNAGNANSVHANLNGSGDAVLGAINGELHLEVAGSGNLSATKVNGPVHIEIAGAGWVKIADGVANPFHVEIAGSGDVFFGGLAVDPHVDALGSGQVKIHAIRGNLNSEGMANIKIGD